MRQTFLHNLPARAHSRLSVTSGAVVPLEAAKLLHATYGPAVAVLLAVEDQSIRRTIDGTTPTTGADGVGRVMADGDVELIYYPKNLKMIAVGTTGIAQVDYLYES